MRNASRIEVYYEKNKLDGSFSKFRGFFLWSQCMHESEGHEFEQMMMADM